MKRTATYTAFVGDRLLASGEVEAVLLASRQWLGRGDARPLLIFEDHTGRPVDFDLRGTPDEVLARLRVHPLFAPAEPRPKPRTGPGRPKLGVVSREVSLLPRHWEWLDAQSQSVSASLRKVIDEARQRGRGGEEARQAREAASRFMGVMAGKLPDYEEAARALFAKDQERLDSLIHDWPDDLRKHLQRLVQEAVRLEAEVEEEEEAGSDAGEKGPPA